MTACLVNGGRLALCYPLAEFLGRLAEEHAQLGQQGPQVSEQNIAVVRRWFEEVWNQGRESSIDELFPAGGVAHGLGDSEQDVHGPDEFKPFVDNIRGAIPDTHVTIDDILADSDRVAVRVTLQGTHTGHGLGVPPTGRKVSIQGIIIVRLVDGRIREGWNSSDQLGLLRQIGTLPGAGKRDTFLNAHE